MARQVYRMERDRARFKEVVRGRIREDLRRYLSSSELVGRQGDRVVSVPVPSIDLPRFRFGSNEGGVGQGPGDVGDAANGDAIYAAKCATCHGATGTAHDIEGRSLGEFAREKPNELWFKAKFGEDGTGMAPGLVTSTSDLQDLYAALVNATNFPAN